MNQGQNLPEKPPLLFLEVNITEGKQAKLMIFEGDNIDTVVNVFSDIYGLSHAKKDKLLDIVKHQMRGILVNIGEAEEEEENTIQARRK